MNLGKTMWITSFKADALIVPQVFHTALPTLYTPIKPSLTGFKYLFRLFTTLTIDNYSF
jgi:hypothetical protein